MEIKETKVLETKTFWFLLHFMYYWWEKKKRRLFKHCIIIHTGKGMYVKFDSHNYHFIKGVPPGRFICTTKEQLVDIFKKYFN